MRSKVALITGAGRRLGRAMAFALLDHGYNIAIHHRQSRKEAETLARLAPEKSLLLDGNLTDPDIPHQLIAKTTTRFGHLDVLINNASIWSPTSLFSMTCGDLFAHLSLNTFAPLSLTRAYAATAPKGAVINLLDCRITDYDKEHTAYHLSKRALFDLTRLLALKLAPDFRVNGIAPGLILPPDGMDNRYLEARKNSTPLCRYGNPDDIVRALLFLLHSPSVTGQTIFVDGGRHMTHAIY